ncbi:MAG: hypothetical protein PUG04_01770 [Lachnospiraceae bacterium]|nr:hypothetical protein [Lachnospiraceae bacterium]
MFHKIKRLSAVLLLTVLALSATFAPVGIDAYATDYTKTEKKMSSSLARYVVDDLKRPSSFQIVKIEKGRMTISSKGMKDYVDSPYWTYEYRVKYKAKNSKGDYSYGWVYFTSELNIWQPDKYKYYKAVDDDDADPVDKDMLANVSKLTSEYYKDL